MTLPLVPPITLLEIQTEFGGITDPYFSQVGLLLHMDAYIGGNNIKDSSIHHNDCNEQQSTPPLGIVASAALFGAAGTHLGTGTTPAGYIQSNIVIPANLDYGSADCTLEGWFYPTTQSGSNLLFYDTASLANHGILLSQDPVNQKLATGTASLIFGVTPPLGSNGSFPNGQWSHVAVVIASGMGTVYINGTATGASFAVTQVSVVGQDLFLGGSNFGPSYCGNMDEVRITVGVNGARYLSNFTPSDVPFPGSSTPGPSNLLAYNAGGLYVPDAILSPNNANIAISPPIDMIGFLGGQQVTYLFEDNTTDLSTPVIWTNTNGATVSSAQEVTPGVTSIIMTPGTGAYTNVGFNFPGNTGFIANTTMTFEFFLEDGAMLQYYSGGTVSGSASQIWLFNANNGVVSGQSGKFYEGSPAWYSDGNSIPSGYAFFSVNSPPTITSGIWHKAQIYMDGSATTMYLYIDGIEVAYYGWEIGGEYVSFYNDSTATGNAYVSQIVLTQVS